MGAKYSTVSFAEAGLTAPQGSDNTYDFVARQVALQKGFKNVKASLKTEEQRKAADERIEAGAAQLKAQFEDEAEFTTVVRTEAELSAYAEKASAELELNKKDLKRATSTFPAPKAPKADKKAKKEETAPVEEAAAADEAAASVKDEEAKVEEAAAPAEEAEQKEEAEEAKAEEAAEESAEVAEAAEEAQAEETEESPKADADPAAPASEAEAVQAQEEELVESPKKPAVVIEGESEAKTCVC